jgi:hypothetical protein
MIIQTESAFFSQQRSAIVVILEWFVPYVWAFEIKLTAWRTVYGKPQVGSFKCQRTLYGKPHGRVNTIFCIVLGCLSCLHIRYIFQYLSVATFRVAIESAEGYLVRIREMLHNVS